jgi:pimeloyl-ACP methyl ester carboxylesterase
MTPTREATTSQEEPIFFGSEDSALFGVLTRPTVEPRGLTVIILSGGGTPIGTNVNRLSVRLCRRLAAKGYHSLRFDYHGTGESFGATERFHLARPFMSDLRSAIEWLRASSLARITLIGSCFGARTVLSTAATMDEPIAGVALVCPPVRDFEMGARVATRLAAELTWRDFAHRAVKSRTLSNLKRPEFRRSYARIAKERVHNLLRRVAGSPDTARYEVSPNFLGPLRTLGSRAVELLLIYGQEDEFLAGFERAQAGPLGQVMKLHRPTIGLERLPGQVHGFTTLQAQDLVLDSLSSWVTRVDRSPSLEVTVQDA